MFLACFANFGGEPETVGLPELLFALQGFQPLRCFGARALSERRPELVSFSLSGPNATHDRFRGLSAELPIGLFAFRQTFRELVALRPGGVESLPQGPDFAVLELQVPRRANSYLFVKCLPVLGHQLTVNIEIRCLPAKTLGFHVNLCAFAIEIGAFLGKINVQRFARRDELRRDGCSSVREFFGQLGALCSNLLFEISALFVHLCAVTRESRAKLFTFSFEPSQSLSVSLAELCVGIEFTTNDLFFSFQELCFTFANPAFPLRQLSLSHVEFGLARVERLPI